MYSTHEICYDLVIICLKHYMLEFFDNKAITHTPGYYFHVDTYTYMPSCALICSVGNMALWDIELYSYEHNSRACISASCMSVLVG